MPYQMMMMRKIEGYIMRAHYIHHDTDGCGYPEMIMPVCFLSHYSYQSSTSYARGRQENERSQDPRHTPIRQTSRGPSPPSLFPHPHAR